MPSLSAYLVFLATALAILLVPGGIASVALGILSAAWNPSR